MLKSKKKKKKKNKKKKKKKKNKKNKKNKIISLKFQNLRVIDKLLRQKTL